MKLPNKSPSKKPAPHVVAIVTFPRVQLLDIAGAADVFATANQFSDAQAFEVLTVSATGELVNTTSGVGIGTRSIKQVSPRTVHTLLIAGGEADGLRAVIADKALADWVRRCSRSAVRFGSVCSGAFALAHWGLLDGCRVTTHWAGTALLRRHFPTILVEPESLFVQDGRVWTSGGVTSGIDMCLAMVEQDMGRHVAARVAKQLILSSRRLGNQSQFSVLLETQAGRYAALADWIVAHLREPLTVQRLSDQAGETPRTFHRKFTEATGLTPAIFVEKLRLHAVRTNLEAGDSVKGAARAAGFTSDEHLSRVFRRRFDMTPSQYRAINASNDVRKPNA
jgi:transcriptional regulator GlxA family with amidase domain